MAFPGYSALRNRYPDEGIVLVRKDQPLPQGFEDYVPTGRKVGAHDEFVHPDDQGKF